VHIAPVNLRAQLKKKGLSRAYMVFGDEPLQSAECSDLVRAAARADGTSERLIFEVEAKFDWQQLQSRANEMSLFAERRLIEIRLAGRKPDKLGSEVLLSLFSRDDIPDVFLLTADRLDKNAQKSKWFRALDKIGVTVQVRQIALSELDRWIIKRAAELGMRLTSPAAEFLAIRAEGNLLAAAQELEKLSLMVEQGEVDIDVALSAVVDSARFNVFDLIDVTLSGDGAKAVRVLRGLREEGTEAVVIGWALNRELRNLSYMAVDMADGKPAQSVLDAHNVWSSRAKAVKKVLSSVSLEHMTKMFRDSIQLDRVIKGTLAGNGWDELEWLCLELARKV